MDHDEQIRQLEAQLQTALEDRDHWKQLATESQRHLAETAARAAAIVESLNKPFDGGYD